MLFFVISYAILHTKFIE